jgi:hypothetical protein
MAFEPAAAVSYGCFGYLLGYGSPRCCKPSDNRPGATGCFR